MAEVLTTKLKNDNVRLFYQDLQDNDYYVFVSSVATDPLTRIDAVNSQYSKNEFLEKTLFGKRVFNSDVKFMIKYWPWQKDQVYVQYDDKVNLEDQRFYAVVGPTNNDSGDYRVYKCLANNNGAPSTVPPNYNPVTVNQIYRTADGYVWKYMYYLSQPEFEAYNASGYIPLVGNFEIDPSANANNVVVGSEVSDIFVENFIDNAGYPYLDFPGSILAGPPGNDSTIELRSAALSQVPEYYTGMALYISNIADNKVYVYKIDKYDWNSTKSTGKVTVVGNPFLDGVVQNSGFKILPRVHIEGDGTGAVAIPRIVDGNITNIEVLETGSGYNNITATVVDPLYDFDPGAPNSIDVRAVLRPVLAPRGYHNYNLIDEMHCKHVLVYGYITESDNNKIGRTNTYSVVGLVKNPEFKPDPVTANTASPDVFDNRLAITTDYYARAVQNKILIQRNDDQQTTFHAKVHEVDPSSNTVYLSEYMGPYVNSANSDIALNPAKDLINSTGQRIVINTPVANNIIESRYTQRSGTVYFMEDFFPLERTDASREEYKLVLEF